jgi:hypothetical protein
MKAAADISKLAAHTVQCPVGQALMRFKVTKADSCKNKNDLCYQYTCGTMRLGSAVTKKSSCITAKGKSISDMREQELQCGAGQVMTGFKFSMENCNSLLEELELEDDWIEEASKASASAGTGTGAIKTGRYQYTCAPIIDKPSVSKQSCQTGVTAQQFKFDAGKLITSGNKCLQKGANNLLTAAECSTVAAGTQWALGGDHMLKFTVGSQSYCVNTGTLALGSCPSEGLWMYDQASHSISTATQAPWSLDLKFNCMRCAMAGNGPKRATSFVKMYDRVERITNYASFEGSTRMVQYPNPEDYIAPVSEECNTPGRCEGRNSLDTNTCMVKTDKCSCDRLTDFTNQLICNWVKTTTVLLSTDTEESPVKSPSTTKTSGKRAFCLKYWADYKKSKGFADTGDAWGVFTSFCHPKDDVDNSQYFYLHKASKTLRVNDDEAKEEKCVTLYPRKDGSKKFWPNDMNLPSKLKQKYSSTWLVGRYISVEKCKPSDAKKTQSGSTKVEKVTVEGQEWEAIAEETITRDPLTMVASSRKAYKLRNLRTQMCLAVFGSEDGKNKKGSYSEGDASLDKDDATKAKFVVGADLCSSTRVYRFVDYGDSEILKGDSGIVRPPTTEEEQYEKELTPTKAKPDTLTVVNTVKARDGNAAPLVQADVRLLFKAGERVLLSQKVDSTCNVGIVGACNSTHCPVEFPGARMVDAQIADVFPADPSWPPEASDYTF